MNYFQRGEYIGKNKSEITVNGLLLTEAEYHQDYVDWHYPENTYR